MVAGVGAGKTVSLVLEAWRAAEQQAGYAGAIFAPTFRLFQRVTLPAWRRWVPAARYKWKPSAQCIEMSNGSCIYCLGTDRAEERIVGLNLAWAAMDEAGVAKNGMIPKLVMERIRTGDPSKQFLLLATSPHGHGWLEDWSKQKDAKGRPLVDVVRASTYDNPFLPREYIANLEIDFPPGTLLHRQEMLGEFISAVGLLYGDYFSRLRHVVPFTYDYSMPYVVGADFGARASGWVALQQHGGRWCVVREWTVSEATEDTAHRIARELGKPPIAAHTDTPSKTSTRTEVDDVKALRKIWKGCGVRPLGGLIRTTDYRHRAVRSALVRNELVFSASLVNRRISHDERGLIYSLETMPWKTEKTRDESVDERDQRKHIIDALEFAVAKIIPPRHYDSETRKDELDQHVEAA